MKYLLILTLLSGCDRVVDHAETFDASLAKKGLAMCEPYGGATKLKLNRYVNGRMELIATCTQNTEIGLEVSK